MSQVNFVLSTTQGFPVFVISCSYNVSVGMVLVAVTETTTRSILNKKEPLLFYIAISPAARCRVLQYQGPRFFSLLCSLECLLYPKGPCALVIRWLLAAAVAVWSRVSPKRRKTEREKGGEKERDIIVQGWNISFTLV